MRINHNIAALNTYRQLNANTINGSKSLEKLSSGLRINRAGDDAAGLAISEKMRSQIRGLDQAARNAQDGISMIQTAEGALCETHSILQRIRELAVQSANGTLEAKDRSTIQDELNELVNEINRIASDTEFNEKKLLNGSIGITSNKTADTANIGNVIVNTSTLDSDTYTVTVSGTANVDADTIVDGGINSGAALTATEITPTNVLLGSNYSVEVSADTENADKLVFTWKNGNGDTLNIVNNIDTAAASVQLTNATYGSISLADSGGDWQVGTLSFNIEGDWNIKVENSGGSTISSVALSNHSNSTITLNGFGSLVNVRSNMVDNTATVNVINNAVKFQIGANANQETKLAINNMDSAALGIQNLSVLSADLSGNAIFTVDNAITMVSAERAKLGAYQNRLEHTINNLGTSAENLTASESRIRDVDMAKEMMEFTKNNILSQAAQAMLAQANQQPQGVLQLLR